MRDNESVPGWPEVLSRLDRHPTSSLVTPDVASLPELMETYAIPGMSIAVGRRGGDRWTSGYGTTGAAEPGCVNSHTAFQACSISKHVAAFGALRLVGDGVLDLDADIDDYLASWHLPASDQGWRPRVTLRQLLAHTAGLSYNWFRGYGPGEPVPSLLQTLRGEAPANTPPVRPSLLPGSQFRYSGSHYAVLQQLLLDVTAMPFDELMRTLVLHPVGMSDSSFSQQFPHARPEPVARGHHTTGTPVPGGWRTLPEMAGAGLWTTPADLVRLELEIAAAAAGESQLLAAELAGQMLTPQAPGRMGLGTELDMSAGQLRFGHTGGNVGYECFSFAWPDTGTAVAMMANSEGAGEVLSATLAAAERQAAAAGAEAAGAEAAGATAAGATAAGATAAGATAADDVAGHYLLRKDYPLEIVAEHGRLIAAAAGQRSVELASLPGGRYRFPGLDCEITFELTGESPTMHVRQENSTHTAIRRS